MGTRASGAKPAAAGSRSPADDGGRSTSSLPPGPAAWGPPAWVASLHRVAGALSCTAPSAAPDPADVPSAELPMALFAAFRRFGPSWLRWLRGHVEDGTGITPARVQLLGLLAAAPQPVIMRQLVQALGTTARAVTGLVDGLEAEQLVRRVPHPHDRRAILVELSEQGRASLSGFSGGLTRAAGVFDVLSEDEQRTLLALLTRLTSALGAEQRP